MYSKRHLERLIVKEIDSISSDDEELYAEIAEETEEMAEGTEENILLDEIKCENFNMSQNECNAPQTNETNLKEKLEQWYIKYGISRSSFDELLDILRSENIDLPMPSNMIIQQQILCNGSVQNENKDHLSGSNNSHILVLENSLASIKNTLDDMKSSVHKIKKMQAKNNVLLEQLIKQKTVDKTKSAFKFPIRTSEALKVVDNDIPEKREEYLATLRTILGPFGVIKKLGSVIHPKLLMEYNYDGVKGKKALKNSKNLNSLLLESCLKEGYSEAEYAQDVRLAIKRVKGREFKANYLKKQVKANLL